MVAVVRSEHLHLVEPQDVVEPVTRSGARAGTAADAGTRRRAARPRATRRRGQGSGGVAQPVMLRTERPGRPPGWRARTLARMKVRVDADLCVGHGRCYVLAPDVFGPDDFGHCEILIAGGRRGGSRTRRGSAPRTARSARSRSSSRRCPDGRARLRRQARDRHRRGFGHGRGDGRGSSSSSAPRSTPSTSRSPTSRASRASRECDLREPAQIDGDGRQDRQRSSTCCSTARACRTRSRTST